MKQVSYRSKSEAIAHEQEKRRKRAEANREKVAQRKVETRRHFIVGEMISDVFPDVNQFQPQRTRASNADEFTRLKNFFSILFSDTAFIEKLKVESGWCNLQPPPKTPSLKE